MVIKTKAIVLHALKYSEHQLIVDMLTEKTGRVSFICHIPRTQRGKVKKQYFQPLTVLDLEFDYRPQIRLQHIRDLRLAWPFTTIPFDPEKIAISLFLAEFLIHATRDEQQNPSLFQYIENSIEWLDTQHCSFANFHLVFMMRLSRFIGFFPNLDHYVPGAFFDLRNGSFTLTSPLHSDFLEADESARIGLLMRMSYETMRLFRMSRQERNRCAQIILTYYRLHVPNFPELKSLEVLQDLYAR